MTFKKVFVVVCVPLLLAACNPSKDSEEAKEKLASVSCKIQSSTTQVNKGSQITANLNCDLKDVAEDLSLSLKYDPSLINLSASGQTQSQAGSLTIALPKNDAFQSTLNIRGLKAGKGKVDLNVGDISQKWSFEVVLPTIDFSKITNRVPFHTSHSIKSDGSLWAWGRNNKGQLGDGTTTDRLSPTKIGSDQWKFVFGGLNGSTLAIQVDDTLWAWGQNNFGQLGDGTKTNRPSPIKIGSDLWKIVSSGINHSLGLKPDGSLWAWGDNSKGQLGDGTTTGRLSPVKIGSDQWKIVSTGDRYTLAIQADGSLWAWGRNHMGQLGDGTTTERLSPVKIGSDTDWDSVYGGAMSFTLALKSDGSLWAWGRNHVGQLGDGTKTDRLSPVKIGSDQWKMVSTGGNSLDGVRHSLGIKKDGTLWAWGENDYGQLGDGTTTDRLSPVKIGSDTDWDLVYGGGGHSIGVKTNGEIYSWGDNFFGQLGDGTKTSRNAPAKISF